MPMNDTPGPGGLPTGPDAGGGPVFAEPWEAQAFAMVLSLHEQGLFTWPEWAQMLAATIEASHAQGDPDLGDTYYRHWLAALEAMLVAKGVASAFELSRLRDAWDRAADRTPHGSPIELRADDFGPAA